MIALRCIAAVAILGASLSAEVSAQHYAPVGLRTSHQTRSTKLESSAASRDRVGVATADTTETKQSVKPYLVGGAILGGIIGGALAADYNPCGDPQPGVYCTSTDVATGAVIGAVVGIGVGWLAWAIANPPRK